MYWLAWVGPIVKNDVLVGLGWPICKKVVLVGLSWPICKEMMYWPAWNDPSVKMMY